MSNTASGHETEIVSSSTLTTHLSKTHLIIITHLPQLETLDLTCHVINTEPLTYDPEIQFSKERMKNQHACI